MRRRWSRDERSADDLIVYDAVRRLRPKHLSLWEEVGLSQEAVMRSTQRLRQRGLIGYDHDIKAWSVERSWGRGTATRTWDREVRDGRSV